MNSHCTLMSPWPPSRPRESPGTNPSSTDIDYARLAAWLRDHRLKPHITLEQAVEAGSPKTLDAVEAHRWSLAHARDLFGGKAVTL